MAGLRIIVYLDDGLCAVAGEQAALEASQLVRTTLDRAGFVAQPEKFFLLSTYLVFGMAGICCGHGIGAD